MVQRTVCVIGAGLSGLTAAREILNQRPHTNVVVLEAMDRVGGKTLTIDINGFAFDMGAEFIGESQKHIIELAKESKNELLPVWHSGTKLIEMNSKIYTYNSDIPNNVHVLGLLQMQFCIWKINRMAKKVNCLEPAQCQQGYYWDSMTVQTWLQQNISFQKVKITFEVALRAVLGTELSEVSFLYFLWYVNQNKDFDNLINVEKGLQEKKTALGTQHFSKYLAQQINKKKGIIKLKYFVKEVHQDGQKCTIINKQGDKMYCDLIVFAISPCLVNQIQFVPQLCNERKIICERSFMGTLTKVLILYKKAYWKDKKFSGEMISDCVDSPLMVAFDDSKVNQNGLVQPAILIFVSGGVYEYWSTTRKNDFENQLIQKIAQHLKEPEMLNPISVNWKDWKSEPSIRGGPVGVYPPGVLTKISAMRKPEGRFHWAGTEMATVSIGYMDGAVESGKRVAIEVLNNLEGNQMKQQRQDDENETLLQKPDPQMPWYTKYLKESRKCIEWW